MKRYYPYVLCLSMLLAGSASAWTLKNTSSLRFLGTNGLSASVAAQSSATIQTPTTLILSGSYGILGNQAYNCKFEATTSSLSTSQEVPVQVATRTSKTAASCSAAKPRLCCYAIPSTGGVRL